MIAKFILFYMFCFALWMIYYTQQRKKTFLLRSLIKQVKNRGPENWAVRKEQCGFYGTEGFPNEYSTKINRLFFKIGKYPAKKENGKTFYFYELSVLTENRIGVIFNGRKIARAYKKIDQEREGMEEIIKKWFKRYLKYPYKQGLAKVSETV